ncbi:hypothetical protein FSP39_009757 [Pinctada imbricata]|uniref:Uncharacterized protein n=1 Tax=Pinctada imbricata TaxID=66713 RepID=A0AA89BVB6_PINIB|nr:hypothetical protein FSP39_009757 [Pinctada imbricata]
MKRFYKSQCAESLMTWKLVLRQILVLLTETIYIEGSRDICRMAAEDAVVLPTRIHGQLCELGSRILSAREIAMILQRAASSVCDKHVKGSANGMVAHRQTGFSMDEEVVSIVTKTKQLQDLLEGCEVLLSSVVNVVEEKAARDTRFFNTMSISIGAICAGTFAWNVWRGVTGEELLSRGLWSACTGFSAVVLQIPRVRISSLMEQLKMHRKQRSKVKEITACWNDLEKLSYSNLVKPDLCKKNGLFSGKATFVDSNCR